MRSYFNNLETFYNHNSKLILNPNFIYKNRLITWNNRLSKSSSEDYEKYFVELLNDRQYSFQFTDGSLTQIFYEFNEKDELVRASLGYFPEPESKFEIFRFDLDHKGAKDYVHSNYHIHFGFNTLGMRISLFHFPKPSEFIKFILAFVYNNSDFFVFNKQNFLKDLDQLKSNYHHYLKLKLN